ncbi:MAG: M4 family metallopeptidase [Thermoleophilia bacterium]
MAALLSIFLAVVFSSLFFSGFAGFADTDSGSFPTPAPAVVASSPTDSDAPQLGYADTAGEIATEVTLAGGTVASVRFDQETGTPAFLTGAITPAAGPDPTAAAISFFDANQELYRMSSPVAELTVSRESGDTLGMTHLHMAQQYKGVPVFGADMAVHFAADGKIVAVNGRYVPGIAVNVEPDLTSQAAVAVAQADLGYEAPASSFEPPLLTVLAPTGKARQLTWKVTLASDDPPLRQVYFVDAHSGEVVAQYNALEGARNRRTYTAGNGSTLPGTLLITEGGTSSDAVAQAAHDNIGATYDYYFNTFGRDSFNGGGGGLNSTVHYGSAYNNAFWNGQQMVYGDGDGRVFSPLGSGLDVVAHELTHGVTQYSANLVYSYQSGALNESYSDVFGVMVDRDDWLMGEDVYTPATPGDALRSLSDPTQYGQPDNMNNYLVTTSDNGGVHTNSGIPNKAAYNIAQSISKDKMERIWYRTLTLYLNSGSQFSDARDASVQSAADLYGATSPEATAVANGFSAVGIGASQQSETTARVEIDHTYRGDLVVTVGVGDPDNPDWSTVVSNRSGGANDNVYATVDISGGAAHLPPGWQNRWFLKVYDAAGYDTGTIRKFSITDHGTTYAATDVPIALADLQTLVSYIPTADSTAPTVTATSPTSGATGYASADVTASFSEGMVAATVNAGSFTLRSHGDVNVIPAVVTFDANANRVFLNPDADLAYSTTYDATVTTAVTDLAGNHMVQSYSWSFTTPAQPRNYYFTWYDQMSPGMRDWLVMGNPAAATGAKGFDISIAGTRVNASPLSVDPNRSLPVSYDGAMGGPVRLAALDGAAAIVSRRTLYGDSLEEIAGMDEARLTSHYVFTWYDAQSSGVRDWILIANPGETAVAADIYIAGKKMNSVPYSIAAGASVTPEFPGVMAGPVEVVGYEPGAPSVPRNIMATQRVVWAGNFNEVMGIPATEISSDYLFPWYDQNSPGVRTWVLVSNPDPSRALSVEISMAGQNMTNSATGDQYFVVGPGESMTPSFPGVINGPVEVKGYDAAGFNAANPGAPNMAFYTTQRSLFGDSFEEVAGIPREMLTVQSYFSWYDQASAGVSDWVLVANPGTTPVKAEVWIAGQKMKVLSIAPGETQAPTFPGVINGPVEVRGYDAATYLPDSPGSANRPVLTSQRVLWKGHFNEVAGMDLS